MHIDLPDGVRAFVFGSARTNTALANDLDIVFVYDSSRIGPTAIYSALSPSIKALEETSGLQVHPVVLSVSEEEEAQFTRRSRSTPLDDWLFTA